MEKLWYKCGTSADDRFEAPVELTLSEAVIISEFLKELGNKNKWAGYCGRTWIDMSKAYITEDECWEHCHNEPYGDDDEIE